MSDVAGIPRFNDPEGSIERRGFEDNMFSNSRLPGMGWEAGNMFNTTLFMPNCDMNEAVFVDRVWGQWGERSVDLCLRQDSPMIMQEIFYSNAMRRLQAVEQLTLPPQYSTIPNTAAFSRFEHLWGSVLFAKIMSERQGLSDEESLNCQLRTLVSDMAHTTGSHIGDWIFQGIDGGENQHDLELEDYLEVTGINDILKKHDIDPKDVVFPDKNDWVEASSPDLCIDRVDYGLREMRRWMDVIEHACFSEDDFVITPENQLAMTNLQRARLFSEGFLLLSQEHWSEPTHRFLEDLYILQTKLLYIERGGPDTWVFKPDHVDSGLIMLHEIHPRDLMYVTDHTQLRSLARPSLVGNTFNAIMSSVAQYHRQYVWPGRRERINNYLWQFTANQYEATKASGKYTSLDDEKFSSYLSEYPAYLPTGFTILDENDDKQKDNGQYIDIPQPPFKVRQIDPLVQTEDGFERLSVLDPSYADRLKEHRAGLAATKIARIAMPDEHSYNLLKSTLANIDDRWKELLDSTRRMKPDEFQALIEVSASEIHGQYPFLSFMSYWK